MKVIIIGGGIGGLTTAIALNAMGIESTVFEAAAEFKPVGAGIIMASNAMQVFHRLGLSEQIKSKGFILHQLGIGNHHGKSLQIADILAIEKKFGQPSVAIRRSELQNILLSQLKKQSVQFNYRFEQLQQNADLVAVHFANGKTIEADLVLASDGIHSNVRNALFGDCRLRYSSHTCWRGMVKVSSCSAYQPSPNTIELWGQTPGRRVALIPTDNDYVYFYYTEKRPEKFKPTSHLSHILEGVQEFPSFYGEFISHASPEDIYHNDLYDLIPLKKWSSGRVLLLGDAAHATTPNLGQGGCQAIEDAWFIAKELSQQPDYIQAFQSFEEKRKNKVNEIVRLSYNIGKLSNIGGMFGAKLRNLILTMTPDFISQRSFEKMFHLEL